MNLTSKQKGVARHALIGLAISVTVVFFGSQGFSHLLASERLALSLLLPAVALLIAIARVANHRFSTPADIDGSGLTAGTTQIKILQALLQNTLEQLALASPIYLVALSSSNNSLQAAVPACACTFFLGRVLFFVSYKNGAGARALGFALTFYPTVLLLVWLLWWLVIALFS